MNGFKTKKKWDGYLRLIYLWNLTRKTILLTFPKLLDPKVCVCVCLFNSACANDTSLCIETRCTSVSSPDAISYIHDSYKHRIFIYIKNINWVFMEHLLSLGCLQTTIATPTTTTTLLLCIISQAQGQQQHLMYRVTSYIKPIKQHFPLLCYPVKSCVSVLSNQLQLPKKRLLASQSYPKQKGEGLCCDIQSEWGRSFTVISKAKGEELYSDI